MNRTDGAFPGHRPVWDIVGGRTWVGAFARLVSEAGDGIAIEDEHGRRVARAGLARNAAAAMAALRERHGVRAGDRVGVHLENTIENAVLVLALGALGAVCAPVSPKLTGPEIARQVGACRLRLLVTDADPAGLPELDVPVVTLAAVVDLGQAGDAAALAAFLDGAASRTVDEPSTIICTSGSTSAPKPIVLSHGNVMFAVASSQSYYALSPLDSGLTFFPWCHSNGHINQLLCWLTLGVRIGVADRFTASGFPAQLDRFDPTVVFMNSTHVKMVLAKLPASVERVPSRMRIVPTALDQSPADVTRFTEVFGALLRKVYYQTELCAPVTVCDLIPPRTVVNHNPLGYVALSHEIQLVDGRGEPVPPGTPGEIRVRCALPYGTAVGRIDGETGELVRNDPAAWWDTGDLAVAEPDGFLYYAGRTSEMVKRAGHNVAIPEVVATLVRHPEVTDAAVIGVPDPMREEQIVAFVQGTATEAEVLAFCRAQLADYKVPSVIIPVDEVPRTDLGKIDGASLRSQWATLSGGQP